jgi:hypothetical protein
MLDCATLRSVPSGLARIAQRSNAAICPVIRRSIAKAVGLITRRSFVAVLASVPALGLLAQNHGAMRSSWNVRAFGATGDGRTLDTRAVQTAINSCNAGGGGLVYLPAGGNFLIGTIYLKNHVTLYLETNARLTGSSDMSQYAKDTGSNPYYPEPMDRCLIYAQGATDIGLAGNGTVVGHGADGFFPIPGSLGREALQRPMLIRFENCERIGITDLSLEHCGAWSIHLKDSRDFSIQNLRIDNDGQDGIVIESSQVGTISNCHMRCGDDCIALITSSPEKPLRCVTITNCQLESSWAAIRFGPASKGNFEDVIVSNCIFYNCAGGGIKLGMFEGAEICNCIFENIVMDQVAAPVIILIATWPDIGSTTPARRVMPVGKIRNLQFRGIRVITQLLKPNARPDRNSSMFFHGHPDSAITNVTLSDFDATFAGGGANEDAERRNIPDMNQIDYQQGGYWTDDKALWGIPPAYGLYARHTEALSLSNVTFSLANHDLRSPLFCFDSEGLAISQFRAQCSSGVPMITARNCFDLTLAGLRPQTKTILLRLEGAKSGDVAMLNNNRWLYTKLFECADGTPAHSVRWK